MAEIISVRNVLRTGVRARAAAIQAAAIVSLGILLSACAAPNLPTTAAVAIGPEAGIGVRPTDLPASQIDTLEHLSASALLARLGPPDFTRRDPPAEFWQYRGATCVLDLFLYPEAGTMVVSHAQSRGRRGTEAVGLGANLCSPFSPETTASTS